MFRRNEKIGIDIDDVLAEYVPELLKFTNSVRRKNYALGDIKTYAIAPWIGLTEYEFNFWRDEFEKNGRLTTLSKEHPEADLMVRRLARNLDVRYITGRTNIDDTVAWLSMNGFPRKDVVSVHRNQKAQYCKVRGIPYLVDDCGETVIEADAYGIHTFMPMKPWNADVDSKCTDIHRVESIADVWTHFENRWWWDDGRNETK